MTQILSPVELESYVNHSTKVESEALLNLGMMYSIGKEVQTDRVLAHKYFNLAAMSGVGEALIHRKEIAIEMDTSEIAEAQRQAREWLEHHVIQ